MGRGARFCENEVVWLVEMARPRDAGGLRVIEEKKKTSKKLELHSREFPITDFPLLWEFPFADTNLCFKVVLFLVCMFVWVSTCFYGRPLKAHHPPSAYSAGAAGELWMHSGARRAGGALWAAVGRSTGEKRDLEERTCMFKELKGVHVMSSYTPKWMAEL